MNYAKKFADCLLQRDLGRLLALTDDKRCHVLKALSALAKFLGVYDDFKVLVRNYGLKWTGRSSDDLLIERLTKVVNEEEMFQWILQVKKKITQYSVFMDFVAATGLRFEEAVNAWNLIIRLARQRRLNDYYVEDKQVLEHFRFREIFIRRTKKAFISFVPQSLITQIAEEKPLTTGAITKRIQRKNLKLRFGDIRELHATILTKHLKPPEIDFLHGRVSTSVFMRNYFNPAWITDLSARTLKATEEMLEEIN